jgi:uncharacterized protein (DUF983 family)
MSGEPGFRRMTRVLGRAARLVCPRCGGTPLFRGWFTMPPACERCGLRFERAQGYFVGAIYVNYTVTATSVIGGYLLLWRYADVSLTTQFLVWIPVAVLLPLWFFRYSRSLWLSLEYLINPEH